MSTIAKDHPEMTPEIFKKLMKMYAAYNKKLDIPPGLSEQEYVKEIAESDLPLIGKLILANRVGMLVGNVMGLHGAEIEYELQDEELPPDVKAFNSLKGQMANAIVTRNKELQEITIKLANEFYTKHPELFTDLDKEMLHIKNK